MQTWFLFLKCDIKYVQSTGFGHFSCSWRSLVDKNISPFNPCVNSELLNTPSPPIYTVSPDDVSSFPQADVTSPTVQICHSAQPHLDFK